MRLTDAVSGFETLEVSTFNPDLIPEYGNGVHPCETKKYVNYFRSLFNFTITLL